MRQMTLAIIVLLAVVPPADALAGPPELRAPATATTPTTTPTTTTTTTTSTSTTTTSTTSPTTSSTTLESTTSTVVDTTVETSEPPVTGSTMPATTVTSTTAVTSSSSPAVDITSTTNEAAITEDAVLMVLAPAAVPPTCTVMTPVRHGSRVGARCVETRLRQLGYTAQTADDFFNPTSVDALSRFQSDVGLSPSGIGNFATLSALGIWRSPSGPTCTVSVEVRRFSTVGARCLETRLRQLGFTAQTPDDNFNATSVDALIQYQHNAGLPTSGAADDFVLVALGIWRSPPASPCFVSYVVRPSSVAGAHCVETRLRQLGFTGQTPDHMFNATSVQALARFQLSQGLPQTGVGDVTTLTRLGSFRSAPAPTCTVSVTVRKFSVVGSQCVESRLRQLGLTGQNPDAMFNETSVVALIQFQFSAGISRTGVADRTTLSALGIWKAPPAALCTVSVTVRPSSTTGARCVETRLLQLGFTGQTPDDSFNATSVQALKYFQHNVGLPADGIAGPATLTALGIWKPPPNPFPVPANSGSGRRIVYSRPQQRIWVVDGNGIVVKTHRVSGRTFEPLAGTYYVYSRSLYTYSASDPSVRWRYMIRFTYGFQGGRIGFHEIPNRYGRPLQTKEQLGLPLSGGCVRQATADAQWLWNWAGIGTKVVVL